MKKFIKKIILSDTFVKLTVYTGAIIFTLLFSLNIQ